jgi:hypothetical protein
VPRNQKVLESVSVSVLVRGKRDTMLSPFEGANVNHWTRQNFQNVVFSSYLKFRAMDKVLKPSNFFFKSKFILQSVVIHLAECYGEGVLQCLGERPSVGPLRRW